MTTIRLLTAACAAALTLLACRTTAGSAPSPNLRPEREHAAILRTLNEETQAFCRRDLEAWGSHWLHEPALVKSYINFADNSHAEMLGWTKIEAYAKTYMAEHPEVEAAPAPLTEADIRLYTNGAWVSFEQIDPVRGHKRETRLMEKVDGAWRIAGMATVIY